MEMCEATDLHIIEFQDYCPTCKYERVPETEDPCNECLENPVNIYSCKPVNWRQKE